MEVEQGSTATSGNAITNHERGMYVVWEDLTVVLPNFGDGHTRRLLNGLTGYAEPNRIMAVMGPSGSGKSTLLDALAGFYLASSLCLCQCLFSAVYYSFLSN